MRFCAVARTAARLPERRALSTAIRKLAGVNSAGVAAPSCELKGIARLHFLSRARVGVCKTPALSLGNLGDIGSESAAIRSPAVLVPTRDEAFSGRQPRAKRPWRSPWPLRMPVRRMGGQHEVLDAPNCTTLDISLIQKTAGQYLDSWKTVRGASRLCAVTHVGLLQGSHGRATEFHACTISEEILVESVSLRAGQHIRSTS